MIIFFNLKTGDIYGTVDGRVHGENVGMVRPSNVNEDEVGSYKVSFKPVTRKMIRPITKMLVDPKTLEVNTYKVGEEEVDEPNGLEMDDQFADFFSKVESGTEKIYNYRFEVENGEVVGVVPRLDVSK